MLLSNLQAQAFKELPKKYQMVIFQKFKAHFAYKSKRRFNQILIQEVHPTPDEYNFLTNKISEYLAFYQAKPDATIKTVPLQILQ
jgi:ABC-type oligopeptide transport system ATPase subunit